MLCIKKFTIGQLQDLQSIASLTEDLIGHDVHIWYVELNRYSGDQAFLSRVLSQEELERGNRFRKEADRQRFLRCRALLRYLLSVYSKMNPDAIEFDYGAFGKPSMQLPPGSQSIRFNLSHSRDTAVFCFSRTYEVGIDIEWNQVIKFDELAQHVLSVEEADRIYAFPPHDQSTGLLRVWTRKEALAKGMGIGLCMDMKLVTVDTGFVPDCDRISLSSDDRSTDDWLLYSLDFGQHSSAAVSMKAIGFSK